MFRSRSHDAVAAGYGALVLRFVTFALVVFSATSFAEPNLGIVDLQRAIDASTEGQAARQQLRALVDSKTLSNTELASRERAALEPIVAKLNTLAARLAADHRLVAVLDRTAAGVLASTPSLDFTAELISRAAQKAPANVAEAPRSEALVGFADVSRILQATVEGREAKKRLQQLKDTKQRELNVEQERFREQNKRFEASADLMTSPAGRALKQSFAALQVLANDSTKALADAERVEIARLLKKLDPLLVDAANEAGVAFVFDVGTGVVWFDPRRDVTDELIRRFDGQPARPLPKVALAGTTTIGYVDSAKLPAGTNVRDAAARFVAEGRGELLLEKANSSLVFARPSLERSGELQQGAAKPSAPVVVPIASDALPQPTADSAIDKAPITRMRQNDAYAVVIGVENYRGQLPPADHAENDAAVVSRYLVRTLGVPADHVKTLVGQGASKSDIEAALQEWLPATKASPGATVYFYFSGHGAPDPTTGDSYLVPWDGDPAFLKTKGLRVSEVYSKLTALKGRRVLALLDACFSGTGARSVLPKGVRPLVLLKPVEAPKGLFASLTASGAAETSGPATTSSHGLFTEQLLRGLSGLADRDGDHVVSLHELNLFVTRQVKDLARAQGREQTPTLSVSGVRAPGEWTVVDGLVDE